MEEAELLTEAKGQRAAAAAAEKGNIRLEV